MSDTHGDIALLRTPASFPSRILFGFIAGFVATLVFHQLSLWVLFRLGVSPFAPFQMEATQPFGVPAMISLAFWGGVWGSFFALICNAFPSGTMYWVVVAMFGGIAPSLVALVVVLPLKGMPMGGGWGVPLLITAFVINAAWGIGTALILQALARWRAGARPAPA